LARIGVRAYVLLVGNLARSLPGERLAYLATEPLRGEAPLGSVTLRPHRSFALNALSKVLEIHVGSRSSISEARWRGTTNVRSFPYRPP
jgi:hypothetical protein